MEDNFKNRQDLVSPDENLSNSNGGHLNDEVRQTHQHSGIGPRTKDGKFWFVAIKQYLYSEDFVKVNEN